MSEYPEHEKLARVKNHSQAIGQFLEWLQGEKDVFLQVYKQWEEERESMAEWAGESVPRTYMAQCEGYVPLGASTTDLLGEYFDIDQTALEGEKVAMLEAIREASRMRAGGPGRGSPMIGNPAKTSGLTIKDRRGSKIGWAIPYAARRKMRRALRRSEGWRSSKEVRQEGRMIHRGFAAEKRMVQRYVGIINRETPKQRKRRLR